MCLARRKASLFPRPKEGFSTAIAAGEPLRVRGEAMKKNKPPKAGAPTPAAHRSMRNRQRLGGNGVGLSLQSFANAKSTNSSYNPALIKKQREFYRNAKIVKKYKGSLKQQYHYEEHLPAASTLESKEGNKNEKSTKRMKKNGSLQSAREEYEKRQEEKERARKEREAIIQAKGEERATATARRKALREKMFRRTVSGQPVMKYRLEHLLESLENSSN